MIFIRCYHQTLVGMIFMRFLKPFTVTALFCSFFISIFGYASTSEKLPSIQFGTIPVLQSLPLFVAAEKGFFREQGLNVQARSDTATSRPSLN